MHEGLPGAGKTYWAEKHRADQPEKNYNILGTNNLIDKMKVEGLSRKRNYTGRWEELIKQVRGMIVMTAMMTMMMMMIMMVLQCTECFNKLLELASRRRRNYILDQTNVFPTARGKKLRPFNGFQVNISVVKIFVEV